MEKEENTLTKGQALAILFSYIADVGVAIRAHAYTFPSRISEEYQTSNNAISWMADSIHNFWLLSKALHSGESLKTSALDLRNLLVVNKKQIEKAFLVKPKNIELKEVKLDPIIHALEELAKY